jgi:hypothetical protein
MSKTQLFTDAEIEKSRQMMNKQFAPTSPIALLLNLSPESIQDIANAANRLKEREYCVIGQIAPPITAGDVRLILQGYASLLHQP